MAREPGVTPADDGWFTVTGTLERETLPAAMPALPFVARKLPPVPKGLPPAPASCSAFVAVQPEAVSCDTREEALSSLAEALHNPVQRARNARLAGLEGCDAFPPGLITALRAEQAPGECGDVLVRPILEAPPPGLDGAVHDTLLGLGLAAMMSRAAHDPPVLQGEPTKDAVKKFTDTEMFPWVEGQASAIQSLAAVGAELRYYGKGVVAVEAGMADMRFVDAVRAVPLPKEYEADDELRETYLLSLETALGPRKQRGRDAALVGLGVLATVGVLRDARVERARALLSRMFGGRPINALDELLLPPLGPVAGSPEQKLASRLPTFYAGFVFPADTARDPAMLRMLIERGLSLPHRIALRQAEEAGMSEAVRLLAARVRLELGQNYWRRVDFDEATNLLARRPKEMSLDDDAKLLLAVALALRGGHANAAEMMIKAPIAELGIGDVKALEGVASAGGPHAGRALFDAALIQQLAAPATAPSALWRELAARYDKAASLLEDVRHKKVATARAQEAKQTADAIDDVGAAD